MVGLLALAGVALGTWAWLGDERIPTNNGAGFDGWFYWQVVKDPSLIVDHGLNLHRFQRIVPCLLVWALLRPFGLNTEIDAVVATFMGVNFVLLMVCSLLWWQVARRLELSRVATWVGWTALFVNYPALKLSSFYAVLTDRFGFALGVLLVWIVVTRQGRSRAWWLLGVAVVGAFTWATITYSALLLFVLDQRRPHRAAAVRPGRGSDVWGIAAAGVAALGVAGAAVYARRCGTDCVIDMMVETTMAGFVPLSVLLVALWVFLALLPLAARLTPGVALGAVIWWRVPVAALVLLAISRVQHAASTASEFTLSRTLWNTSLGSVVKPLGFLVTHATYYGPAVLLLVFTWRLAVRRMSAFGPAMLALLVVYLLLGVSTESRILVNQWPFFALSAALVVHEFGWGQREALVFGAVSLALSRVWLPLHHGPITLEWWTYPSQWYFMANGPTTTTRSYLVLLAATVATSAVVWWLRLRERRAPVA